MDQFFAALCDNPETLVFPSLGQPIRGLVGATVRRRPRHRDPLSVCLVHFRFSLLQLRGLLRVFYLMVTYPNQLDWSFSGLYWSSLSDFYSFVLFMLVPPRPVYAALILAAAFYLALLGFGRQR
jgi:hypothetical protein